jgi:MYXO-CTERM domain-containing protein
MRYLHCAILVAIYFVLSPLPTEAGPGNPNDPNVSTSTYILMQLTNNETDDQHAVISGTNVAWRNAGDGNSYPSVMLRNPTKYGQVHQNLGSHTIVSTSLNIDENIVAFSKHGEVHISDGNDPVNISQSFSNPDDFPQIAYPFVTYRSDLVGMQLYNIKHGTTSDLPGGNSANRLTFYDKGNNEYGAYHVYVEAVGGDCDIWAYDLLSDEVTQVTNNNQQWNIHDIDVKGDHVVWSANYDDSAPTAADYEIYGYHLDVGPSSYTQISQNDLEDHYPQTNGQVVLWQEETPASNPDNLMIHQNGTTSLFAQSGTRVNIDETTIAWIDPLSPSGGMRVQTDGVDYDFSSFAGSYSYFAISGKNIVWSEWDGNDDEIWAAFWGGSNAILTGLDLSLINLGGLQLTDADLRFTSLRSALIEGTDFRGADLTGATSLQYAIGQAIFSHETILPAYFNAYDAGWTYVTPEPSTLLLALFGLALLPRRRRR